jgi:5-methylcytosine-specific restriction endonuclease McrA
MMTMTTTTTKTARNPTQGMNWIRPVKRLAIYLRDGLACCWCGATLEDGVILTLDHLKPNIKGGTNDADNLVTCCHRCNSSRGKRGMTAFAKAVASYLNHGVKPETILTHIQRQRRRVLDMAAAHDLMKRRGNFSKALKAAKR